MVDEPTLGPPPSRPTELQQLEAALAAGIITPELFATLKAKLQPAELPTTAPAPVEELPSLLDMFSRAPSPVETPVPLPAPMPSPRPPAAPPVASPPRPSAAEDAAARQRIAEHLAKIRQAPPAAPPLPPAPPPTFYPEPPAPTFYPEPKPTPPVMPVAPVVVARPPAPPARPPRPGKESVSDGRNSASWLLILLVVAVVGAAAYFFTSSSHPDEELTSPAPPAAEAPVVAPPPASRKPKKPARAPKRKPKAARVIVPVKNPGSDSVAAPAAAAASPAPTAPKVAAATPAEVSRPIAAVSEAGDDAAASKVRAAMASYYADLNAPPLHASQHFAPQVERLYIRQNLTPDAIDAELARSFFPDNQQAVSRIEPGTLRVSDPAADGSRTATFTEQMRLYRASLQKYQRLRTQVRVRFNAAYQIVYMRQEKLLANAFED